MENIDFLAVGYCSNDYLAVLPEIPLDGKVQILEQMVQGGGPAATAAVAAARLGMKTGFIGVTGDDEHGVRIRRDLEQEGICTSAMKIRANCASAIAYCWIEQSTGKRSIAWSRGDFAELKEDEVDLEMIRQAEVIHLDGHNPAGALAAAKEARRNGIMVSLDAGTLRPEIRELMPYVTILIASEDFARRYTGEDDLEKALLKLGENGSEVTGITMGCKGSMVLENGKAVYCPAFSIKAVDTTGAGDVYHGAFAVRYCETGDLRESMRFASAVSALKCLKPGGRTGIPTRSEVEKFLAGQA